jgi:uncharacterized heparinase superfamily protein
VTADAEPGSALSMPAAIAAGPSVPRWRRQLAATVFRTNFYQASLRRGGDTAIAWTPPTVVAGSATRANAMFQGRYTFDGYTVESATEAPWRMNDLATTWIMRCHEFGWLADFAAANGTTARRQTRELIRRWIVDFARWSPLAWRPDVLGIRLVSWLAQADLLLVDAEPDFTETFLRLIGEQYRHLGHAQGLAETATDRSIARASYLTASFALGQRLATSERHLDRLIAEVTPVAGGRATRSPSDLLRTLTALVMARDASRDGTKPATPGLDDVINQLGAGLRLLTHGDGSLAVFHGGREEDAESVASVVARASKTSPASMPGFATLAQGRLRVIAETAGQLQEGVDEFASALAIEVSIGKERLFVNCGGPDGAEGAWRTAARATAAHTALVINDRNQGCAAALSTQPDVLRGEEDDNAWLEIAANGYGIAFGVRTTRRFHIAKDGHELVGEERIHPLRVSPPEDSPTTLCARYHLHPKVSASPLGDGRQILLRLGNGTGWVFEAAECAAEIEDSVYFGDGGKPRRTKQIVITRPFEGRTCQIVWHLMRMDGRTSPRAASDAGQRSSGLAKCL